ERRGGLPRGLGRRPDLGGHGVFGRHLARMDPTVRSDRIRCSNRRSERRNRIRLGAFSADREPRGGDRVTAPDQGREDEAKRKPSRRVPPDENHVAENESYSRLLEELDATDRKYAQLLDELKLLDDRKRIHGQRASPRRGTFVSPSEAVDDQGPPVRVRRGRQVAAIAAVLLTALSISYFVLKSLSSVPRFDI